MVALLLGLLVALALLRHDLAVGAVAGAVATVAVTLAGQALNNWLSARSWGQHHDSDLQHVLDNARDLGSLENVAALGLGQYWYLFVATFGLIVLGLVYLGTHLLPTDPGRVVSGRAGPPARGGRRRAGGGCVPGRLRHRAHRARPSFCGLHCAPTTSSMVATSRS